MTGLPQADRVVDAVGLFCPIPVIRTGRAVCKYSYPGHRIKKAAFIKSGRG